MIKLLVPQFLPYGIKIIVDKIEQYVNARGISVAVTSELSDISENDFCIPLTIGPTYSVLTSAHLKHQRKSICFLMDSPSLGYKSVCAHALSYKFGYIEVWKDFLKSKLYRYRETVVLRNYEHIFYVSSVDALFAKTYLTRNPLPNIGVARNGVEIPQLIDRPEGREGKISFGILTSFSPGAYLDIKWFLEKIWSKLQLKSGLTVELIIAGRGGEDYKDRLQKFENVKFIGEVDHLSAYYKQVHCSLLTVRKSCGLLNKGLESIAYGVPVLGLKYHFDGLPGLALNMDYLTFSDALDFQNSIHNDLPKLIADFDRQASRGRLIEFYGWEKNYKELIERIVDEYECIN